MSDERPRAGWYGDPESAGQLRWWDGDAWSEHRRPAPDPSPEPGIAAEAADARPAGAPMKVETWQWQSIVVTLLCCLPVGLVAVIFSAQAQGAINVADFARAEEKARLAKTFTIVAIVFGALFVGGWLLLLASGVAAGFGI